MLDLQVYYYGVIDWNVFWFLLTFNHKIEEQNKQMLTNLAIWG